MPAGKDQMTGAFDLVGGPVLQMAASQGLMTGAKDLIPESKLQANEGKDEVRPHRGLLVENTLPA